MKYAALFFLLLTALCCKQDPMEVQNVDADLQPYVDQFYIEAANRGYSLSRHLDAVLSTEISQCGQGHSPNFNGMFDKPTILISESCWATLNEDAREILVFHELGHALLNRLHIDGTLPNGYSKSIMCAGTNFDCSDLPDYLYCSNYREYYLDELFDPNTSIPSWSTKPWSVVSNVFSDFNNTFSDGYQVFTECAQNTFTTGIDSTDLNRPGNYSFSLDSDCGYYLTVRKRIKIDNPSAAEAIRLQCDLFHNLSGEGFRIGLFVKNADQSFSTYNRSIPREIVETPGLINDFSIQAECLSAQADSLIIDFQYLPNTTGEILIGNLDISLLN